MSAIELHSKQKDTDHDNRFNELTAMVIEKTTEFNDMVMKVDKQGSERENRTVELIGELATSVQKNRRELVDLCGAVEKRGQDAAHSLEDQIAENSDSLIQLVNRVERGMDQMETRQSDRVTELQGLMDEGQLQVANTTAELRVKLTARTEDLEDAVQKNHQHMVAECERLQQKAASESKHIDKKVDRGMTMLHEKLGALTEKQEKDNEERKEDLTDVDVKYGDRHKAADERLSLQNELLSSMVRETREELVAKEEALSDAIQGQHAHFTAQVVDLDERLNVGFAEVEEKAAHTAEELGHADKKYSQLCEELMEHFTAKTSTLSSALQAAREQLDAVDQGLEETLHEKTRELAQEDQRLSDRLDEETGQRHEKVVALEAVDAALGDKIDQAGVAAAAATAAVGAASEGRDAAQSARVGQLEVEMGGKLTTAVEELQHTILKDLKPLMSTVDEMGGTLTTVGEKATNAEATATKVELLAMDVEEVQAAVTALDEHGHASADEIEKLETEVSMVSEELSELSTELTLVTVATEAGM